MNQPEVTVIVPVRNRRDLLERLLLSLKSQTRAAAEVLVVDDGSTDGSTDLAESMGARAIQLGSFGGFARAVNRGIRECRTEWLAIVNNDVGLAPDWLEKLAASMVSGVWFATGRILQAADPGRIDATYDALCRGGTPWRVGNGCLDSPSFREPREIRLAPFTAALFRAELFDKVGLLDELYESYLEDADFGLRCALAGCPGRYVPEAVAWHVGSATLGRWHPKTTRLIARNQVLLVAKYFPARLLAKYAWHIVVAQGLWGLVALRHGRGLSWCQGKLEAIGRFREFRARRSEPPASNLVQILSEGEREILRIQQKSRRDFYWTLYFLLTAGGAK